MKAKIIGGKRIWWWQGLGTFTMHAKGESLKVMFLEIPGLTVISPEGSPDLLDGYLYTEVELIAENDWDRGFLRGQAVEAGKTRRSNIMRRIISGFKAQRWRSARKGILE